MLTIGTENVIVVSIYVSLEFRRHEQSWDSCVTGCTCVHSRNAREISRRSIGVVRAGGFRNNVSIAKDRCILFTKKLGTVKNLVIMRKEFESRHFSGPDIDYIDEIPISEPKRQNDDKAAKEEASNQQRKRDLHPRSQRSKSKIAF